MQVTDRDNGAAERLKGERKGRREETGWVNGRCKRERWGERKEMREGKHEQCILRQGQLVLSKSSRLLLVVIGR